jgi:hypothetical protein
MYVSVPLSTVTLDLTETLADLAPNGLLFHTANAAKTK